ncbi:hypothetical protein AMD27_02020 [Acinetobacter sp. TGL-Y2]|uniref:hypothetical protein n=1 Tax=Acinetobacter sp. TGL-Y2 TaxID=1407071 RepID=UPI0007A66B4A|nr:hypothetical protein [Acinetobacter sp. TGL-Y2]AMW77783.1 hypothetical protein AMD27_02020 [Acinetobacter sp. TGL-Y2]
MKNNKFCIDDDRITLKKLNGLPPQSIKKAFQMNLERRKTTTSFFYRYIRLALIPCIGLTFSACQTTHQQNKQALALYLNQYVGEQINQLEQSFNLDSFNIKLNPNPIITSERAIYSFDRILSIPIPAGNMIKDSHGVMIPVQISSVDNNYKTKQPCNIIFVLKNHIVQSVSIKGKAC